MGTTENTDIDNRVTEAYDVCESFYSNHVEWAESILGSYENLADKLRWDDSAKGIHDEDALNVATFANGYELGRIEERKELLEELEARIRNESP